MKKIMIDMDNVICEGGFLKVVNKFLDSNYKIEDIKDYYVQKLNSRNKKNRVVGIFEEK